MLRKGRNPAVNSSRYTLELSLATSGKHTSTRKSRHACSTPSLFSSLSNRIASSVSIDPVMLAFRPNMLYSVSTRSDAVISEFLNVRTVKVVTQGSNFYLAKTLASCFKSCNLDFRTADRLRHLLYQACMFS